MFKTGESAYEARRELWEQRRAREAQMKEAQRQEGQGRVAPLAVVPELDGYLFDLQGYFIIRGAVGPEELAKMNAQVDANDPAPGQALGITPAEVETMAVGFGRIVVSEIEIPNFSVNLVQRGRTVVQSDNANEP